MNPQFPLGSGLGKTEVQETCHALKKKREDPDERGVWNDIDREERELTLCLFQAKGV